MSDQETTATIKGRPFPFEIKTALMQLFGIGISTPNDVADVGVEWSPIGQSVSVRVYVGGYNSRVTGGANAAVSESISLYDGTNVAEKVKAIEDLIAKVNAATANGRQVKIDRIRAEANELLRKASELEAAMQVATT